jgi:hypothetical protein
MCVCILYLVSGARSSVETNIMRACVCIWYCSISAWRSFTFLLWKRELVVAVISNVHICETEFCILASPAIWWRSLKLIRWSMTFGSHGPTSLKYSNRCVCGGMLSSTSGITRVITNAKRIIVPVTISRRPLSILVGWLSYRGLAVLFSLSRRTPGW